MGKKVLQGQTKFKITEEMNKELESRLHEKNCPISNENQICRPWNTFQFQRCQKHSQDSANCFLYVADETKKIKKYGLKWISFYDVSPCISKGNIYSLIIYCAAPKCDKIFSTCHWKSFGHTAWDILSIKAEVLRKFSIIKRSHFLRSAWGLLTVE